MSSEPKSGQGNKGTGNNLAGSKPRVQARMAEQIADDSPGNEKTAAADADQPRYQWPPPRDPNLVYGQKTRNPLQALITALPLIMLIIGLYIYYRGEAKQTHSSPILAESVQMSGVFTGLSATSGRHYLWIEQAGVAKGVRLHEEQATVLDDLVRGEVIELRAAPSVHASTTYWVLRIEQSGRTFLDAATVPTDQ